MTIGQFAAKAGVTARTIRHYEKLGLLGSPLRSSSGYRLYQPADLKRIRQIRALVELGISLRQVRHLLDSGDLEQLLAVQLAVTEKELQRLSQLRDKLQRLSCSLKAGNLSVLMEVVEMLEEQEFDPILLELGRDLIPLVDPTGPQPLLTALRQLRAELRNQGRQLGDIRVKDEQQLPPRDFRLSLYQKVRLQATCASEDPAEALTDQLKPILSENPE